ncbi:unnamed protein product [Caenorhabditis angaria]|uniref:Uncharacterized protein n=1 Tax=Caenorhabditis angaria TaxID=860376 RepID=A0A9P1J2X3_9PELO|nr:unnamed protein product [Caenorhabditis angaria]
MANEVHQKYDILCHLNEIPLLGRECVPKFWKIIEAEPAKDSPACEIPPSTPKKTKENHKRQCDFIDNSSPTPKQIRF